MENITISIEGMSCVVCAQRIEKALIMLDGVKSASVNFATEKATVFYDPKRISEPSIKNAITKTGYKVLNISKTHVLDEDRLLKRNEFLRLRTKFISAVLFTFPLLYITMVPMLHMTTTIHLPFPTVLDPMDYPLIYALTQLLLTLPIVGVGYKFYTHGFK
jgi:Cu+-exporting ATPase